VLYNIKASDSEKRDTVKITTTAPMVIIVKVARQHGILKKCFIWWEG